MLTPAGLSHPGMASHIHCNHLLHVPQVNTMWEDGREIASYASNVTADRRDSDPVDQRLAAEHELQHRTAVFRVRVLCLLLCCIHAPQYSLFIQLTMSINLPLLILHGLLSRRALWCWTF